MNAPVAGAPRVTVIIPSYNYARFLPEAIESVLAQDFRDFELLIADDASTDHSGEIIAAYAMRDARIRYHIHPHNLGMVPNWNWCLAAARGKYVKFLLADDVLTSISALRQLVGALERNPDAPAVSCARQLLDASSRVTGTWCHLRAGRHDGARLIARCLLSRRNLIGEPTAVLFHRAAAQRGFDPSLRQIVDLELWFHLLLAGPLVHLATPLVGFRRHQQQQTAVNLRSDLPQLELIRLCERYWAEPAIRTILPPSGLAAQKMIFRQVYYARKTRPKTLALTAALARFATRQRRGWLPYLWLWHRLTRPLENLWRHLPRTRSPDRAAANPLLLTRPARP